MVLSIKGGFNKRNKEVTVSLEGEECCTNVVSFGGPYFLAHFITVDVIADYPNTRGSTDYFTAECTCKSTENADVSLLSLWFNYVTMSHTHINIYGTW